MPIKKPAADVSDDLRPEYDLSKLRGGVRGKYYERATKGTTLVLLDPDVAEAFADGQTVNQALRALMKVAQAQSSAAKAGGIRPDKQRQPPTRTRRKAGSKPTRGAARG